MNSFSYPVLDAKVHPIDQAMMDVYVFRYGVSSTSVRPKRGGLHEVTLASGDKTIGRVLGKKLLKSHTKNNLIKVINRNGTVRYYEPSSMDI